MAVSRTTRIALGIVAVVNLALALAFAFRASWAIDLLPWTTASRLTHIFLGSILAAIAAGTGWIAMSGERGPLPAGFLNLTVLLGGLGSFFLVEGIQADDSEWIAYGIGALLLAVLNAALFARTRSVPAGPPDPLPRVVRGSYLLFGVVLLAVGAALIFQRESIMPWPLDPDSSVVAGWIFFGNAFYFLYAVLKPHWPVARAQLWSFLAYDLVLLGPLIAHFSDVTSDRRLSLIVYVTVMLYSAALAIAYVVVNPRTRGWGTPSAAHADETAIGD